LLAKTGSSEMGGGLFNAGILVLLGGMLSQGKTDILDKSEEALLKNNASWSI